MGMHCIQFNPLTHILHKLELIKREKFVHNINHMTANIIGIVH